MISFEKLRMYTVTQPDFTSRKVIDPDRPMTNRSVMKLVESKGWYPRHFEFRTEHEVEASDPVILFTTAALVYSRSYLYIRNKNNSIMMDGGGNKLFRYPDTALSWTMVGDMPIFEVTMTNNKAMEIQKDTDPEYKRIPLISKGRSHLRFNIEELVCEDSRVIESPDMVTLCKLIGSNQPNLCHLEVDGKTAYFKVTPGDYIEHEKRYYDGLPREMTASEERAMLRDRSLKKSELWEKRTKEIQAAILEKHPGVTISRMDDLRKQYADEKLRKASREIIQ